MVDSKFRELEEYAEVNNIPIMQRDGIEFVLKLIKENNIKNILEIGTAIGYSAIKMASSTASVRVTSIERDKERYLEAIKNIDKFKLADKITLIFGDALELEITEKFDLIFIDAAKAQNKKLFLKYENNLCDNGYIITDNLDFHGYVPMKIEDIDSKNIKGLVRKIKDYIEFLDNNDKYETIFYELGDGVSVSKRK